MANNYLFYISQNYSFEILRPIQNWLRNRGDFSAWFVEGSEINSDYFQETDAILHSIEQIINFQPVAVFVPGNRVPNFIPGIKVQVFHGLEWKKKSHFKIRGFFDLYCTHGENTTSKFKQLAEKHQYFDVVETGWPKLDPLFKTPPIELATTLPVILFAPTFSPNLTCALACLNEIKKIVERNDLYWLVKFHPKMNENWIDLYRQIESKNFEIIETDSSLPLLQRADILLSDTSSIISEFMLLDKPVITYKNAKPGDYLVDINSPGQLEEAIQYALTNSNELLLRIKIESKKLHPYKDGCSSKRVLDAVDNWRKNDSISRKKKPLNLLRGFKLRKKLNYWKFY